jgi:DNA-binding transcriptional regulator YhcF (GntR family)
MFVRVDPDSEVGLAQQIAGQIRGAIGAGDLEPGAKLPAARQLAHGLAVNMHTVLRAYSQLRDEGLIDLRRGRGAHVRADVVPDDARLVEMITALVEMADRHGMSRDTLVSHISKVKP